MKQNNNKLSAKQRDQRDRRYQNFRAFIHSIYKGERVKARRQLEIDRGYYTDKYEKWVLLSVLSVVLLSALDAFFTLNILERGGAEANPLMAELLTYGNQTFWVVKMAITAICLLFALVHINFHLFRIMSVKFLLKSVLVFYILLICYELFLLAIL